jgi:hypothetical protein
MKHANTHGQAGFTILEVIVALGIFLFGMTAILGLLTFGAALSRTAQLRTHSAAAVQAVTADLEERLFPLVDGEAGEPTRIEKRELPGLPGIVYSANPVQNPERVLEYRVDVELSWKSGGVQRETRFTTILLREVPFGERLRRRFIEGDTKALASPRETAAPTNTGQVNKP